MHQPVSDLINLLDKTPSGPVVLVGDFMSDEYLYGDAERISPEAPVPVLHVIGREARLGGAGFVAAALRGLDCQTQCAGLVGADDTGAHVRSELKRIGADVLAVLVDQSVSTPLKQRLVGLAQHRIRQQLLRVDYENVRAPDARMMNKLRQQLALLLDGAAVLAMEDYNKGLFDESFARWLIDYAKGRSIPVIVDPASGVDYGRYCGADVITPNRIEASTASGIQIKSVDEARDAGGVIRKRFEVDTVLITLDSDGIMLVGPGGDEHIATERQEVFDNTGAGDVVLATIVYALAVGAELPDAAVLANTAGGWEIRQPGAVAMTRDQLRWELLCRHRSHRGKLVTVEQLRKELDVFRQRGKRVAFTNGCFDLLHPGHLTTFESARAEGDLLVVGLNSDDAVRELKGPSRPLINQTDRARMIAALESVDYVVIFDDASVLPLIKQVRPDILVKGKKGRDATPDGVVGYDFVVSYGGRVVVVPIEQEYSTTSIIDTIISQASETSAKGQADDE